MIIEVKYERDGIKDMRVFMDGHDYYIWATRMEEGVRKGWYQNFKITEFKVK